MGKLICSDDYNNYSVAAKLAYRIISRAVEVLVDSESRAGYHRRWGLKPLPCAAGTRLPVFDVLFSSIDV
ncbi:hypothetical protein NC653_041457 [Populus alba x Populus x berolinensis]|uniref:Uncharacterized protein n=1 Tax=Populus alba x Populus x berolinensis TaxID=444605 RepID=A0AAD6L8J6_9ROSI|nr:hypothetical protein NC653_041457 [Populus alba x Populus x berolinensis]